jgi:alpha-maltose-1-phosphate synthase
MRLVYVLLSPTAGMHQYTADLANRSARSFEVHLVTTDGFPRDRYGPKVAVHTPVHFASTGLSWDFLNLADLARLRTTLAKLQPDMVHITGPHLWNAVAVRWLRRKGVPVVHTIHDLEPHPGTRMGKLLGLWNRSVIRASSLVLVHAEKHRRYLLREGVDAASVACLPLLHLFVSYDRLAALDAQPVYVRSEPEVLFFGRLEPYKGLDTLLKAHRLLLRRASEEHRAAPRLAIAGEGKLGLAHLERLPTGVTLLNHFIDDDEAVRLFRRCCVMVLPYHEASQSALVAAAYYFGKPVVATDVGAFDEYVVDGETGYLVPAADTAALADALGRVIWSPDRQRRLGEAARSWYDRERGKETSRLEQIYRGLPTVRG